MKTFVNRFRNYNLLYTLYCIKHIQHVEYFEPFDSIKKKNPHQDCLSLMVLTNDQHIVPGNNNNNNILYLNTIAFKAQSLWGCMQIKFNQMQVFEDRGKPEYLGENRSEQRREPSN